MWEKRSNNKNNLDQVLPHLKKISEAPDLSKLEAIAEARKISIEAVLESERAKSYKALDGRDGSIWIVTNPAAWKIFYSGGLTFKERPLPERYDSFRHENPDLDLVRSEAEKPKNIQRAIF